jgi:hypothetical protein
VSSDPHGAALADTIASLRQDLEGLRESAQLRAVIEQAKGVLVERHGITLDEAFTRLRDLSQQHNVRLVEVAATVVGVVVPESPDEWSDVAEPPLKERLPPSPRTSPAWSALRENPDVKAGTLSALLDSLTGVPHEGDEAAELLLELLGVHGVDALAMFRTSLDGSLRLVGHCGYPGDSVSAWRSTPPSLDVPFVQAAQTGQPLFFSDQRERGKAFPSIAHIASEFEGSASIPVRHAHEIIGVVTLSWREPQTFDADREQRISATVQRVASRLLRHALENDPDLDWFSSILAVHMDPWLLLDAVPSAAGVVQDFVVQATSDRVDHRGTWLGRRLLELWPQVVDDGTASRLAGLARSGGLWATTVTADGDVPWGSAGTEMRAVRVGSRVVLVWRPCAGS